MVPSPRVVRSPLLRVRAWAEPVPVSDLVTVAEPLVKVTLMAAPDSPVTLTAPAKASVEVASVATTERPGVAGTSVSMLRILVLFSSVPSVLVLPAASVNLFEAT